MLVVTGCHKPTTLSAPTEATDPDDVPITLADVDMPETYDAAVDRIGSYRDRIREAIERGTPSKAHRPLDESEFVLDRLPYLAQDAGVPKRQWETVVLAAEEVSELFGEVHAAIDDHRKPDFEKVAPQIDDAIQKLANVPR